MSSARLALMLIALVSCAARAIGLAGKVAPALRFTLRSRTRAGFAGFHVNSLGPLALAVLLSFFCVAPVSSQQKPSEYDVKAAYLFNFGKFLRHTDNYVRTPTFEICILGRDPIGKTIDDIAANESIDNRSVRINRLPDVTAANPCAIVFISSYEQENIREDLAILAGMDVLTVSDVPDFLKRGGMIQFVMVENHVRFAVNLDALNRAHLVLSSELLRVASSIGGKPPKQELR
jgi:hypothetical protein